MSRKNIITILNLLNVPKIGPKRVRALLLKHDILDSIFSLSEKDLCAIDGIDQRLAKTIKSYFDFDYGKKEWDTAQDKDARIISLWDEEYPVPLKNIYNPPVLLYLKGKSLNQKEDTVAIVGSRNTTQYGRRVAQSLAKDLSANDLTIVSGLARGIDTVAHKEVVTGGGKTIAVLGSGVDIIYPAENRDLADAITKNGTIISEFPLGTKPDPGNFPQRNRIISGLSHGTIVVEAGDRSGAMLTALNSIDQNREVFAVPGRIYDKQSVGCLRLIRHGAVPVENAEQIIEHIQHRLFKPRKAKQTKIRFDITEEEKQILNILDNDPKHIDELTRISSVEITQLLTILLQLELKGAIKQIGGKQFIRIM